MYYQYGVALCIQYLIHLLLFDLWCLLLQEPHELLQSHNVIDEKNGSEYERRHTDFHH